MNYKTKQIYKELQAQDTKRRSGHNYTRKSIRKDNFNKQVKQMVGLFGAFLIGIIFTSIDKEEVIVPVEAKELVIEIKVNSNGQAQEVPELEKERWQERMDEMLIRYGRDEDVKHSRWNRVAEKHGIKPPVLVCIAKADSSLGRELKSSHNYGNVGNNDRGDTVHYEKAIAGIDAMGRVLNNKYLGHKQSIGSLSVGGGGNAPFYATSPENWNNNTINCLRAIYKDNSINEDFMIRQK